MVTFTDSSGSVLFRSEHDDRNLDQFFGDEGYVDDCKGYDSCKNKWYFQDLPKEVSRAITILDEPNRSSAEKEGAAP